MDADNLWEIEERLWTADETFVARHLDEGATLVVPGPGAVDRKAILAIVRKQPWALVAWLHDRDQHAPSRDVAVLTYTSQAVRSPEVEQRARCKSTYVRIAGRWRLLLHHQIVMPAAESKSLVREPVLRLMRPLIKGASRSIA